MEFFKKTSITSLFGFAGFLVCVVSNTAFSAEKKPTQTTNHEEIIQAAKRGNGARVLKLVRKHPEQIDYGRIDRGTERSDKILVWRYL